MCAARLLRRPPPYPDAPRWVRRRHYPHFDPTVRHSALRRVIRDAHDRSKVAVRSFLPFIHREHVSPKYYTTKNGRRRKKLKRRPICYAAHGDSHVFACYGHRLGVWLDEAIHDAGLDAHVIAYRRIRTKRGRGKSNVHYAGETFASICEMALMGPVVALAFDVEDFFGQMDHDLLKEQWASLVPDEERGLEYVTKSPRGAGIVRDGGGSEVRLPKDHFVVFRAVTSYAYVYDSDLREAFPGFYDQTRDERKGRAICSHRAFLDQVRGGGLIHQNQSCGIPQGSPISAVLSNAYMMPLDEELKREAAALGGFYRRYSDDLMLVVPAETREAAEAAVKRVIRARKLDTQDEKTDRVCFCQAEDGDGLTCTDADSGEDTTLQYLGFTFDGRQVAIRESSLNRYRLQFRRMIPKIKKRAEKSDHLDARTLVYRLFTRFGRRSRKKGGQPQQNFVLYAERACETLKALGLDPFPIEREAKRSLDLVQRVLAGTSRKTGASRRRRRRKRAEARG